MNELYLNKGKTKVRIHEWGSKDCPTILCLHGLGSTSLSFIELGHLLKNKYHIFAIDLPGHGKTPQFVNEEDYAMPNMVKWIDNVVTNLNLPSFYLLAHSYGADIALHYLHTYPSNVIKVLLLDGGYYIKSELYDYGASKSESINSLQSEIDYYVKDFDDYCYDTLKQHIEAERKNYKRWSNLLEEASIDLVRHDKGKFRWHTNGLTATGAIKSMYDYPVNSIYDKLPKNICLLQSTLPESMNEIKEALTNKLRDSTSSKLVRIEDAGHLLHWDKPDEVAKEIILWFR